MKPLIVTAILAFASTPALAGGWSFGFGIDSDGDVKVGVGYKSDRDRHVYRDHRSHRRHPIARRVERRRARHWVPGHYDTVRRKVFVPGYTKRVWEPAVYEWHRDSCGHRHRVRVRAAGYRTVHVPGRYEFRTEKVWHAGHFEYGRNVDRHRHYNKHRHSDRVREKPTVKVRSKTGRRPA